MSADTFELTMQDPPRQGERLVDEDDLQGMTIQAVFLNEKYCVIVSDTMCWLVIEGDHDGGCDSEVYQSVRHTYSSKELTLADYVEPRDLFSKGCLTHAQFEAIKQQRAEKAAAANKARADRMRREAEMLDPTTKAEPA